VNPKALPSWIIPSLSISILINLGLLGMTTLLSHERGLPEDIGDAIAVSLVNLAPPEPLQDEEVKEPEKPKPEQQADFVPDLVRPNVGATGALDVGIAIDLGGIGATNVQSEFVFEAYELDQPPEVLVRVPPVYPYKAREQGIEGAVQVKILVNSDGTVSQVLVMDARPKNMFEDAVRKSVPQWKFKPGKVEGEAVTAWVVTTIRFEL
jgi:protein TonB